MTNTEEINTIQMQQISIDLKTCSSFYGIPLEELLAVPIENTDTHEEQYCIKINDDVYLYSEKRDRDYYTSIMDLNDHPEEEWDHLVSGYYHSIDEVKKIYGKDWKQIFLECIFEDEGY